MKSVDVVRFVNKVVTKNESGKPFELAPVQVVFLTLLFQYIHICQTFIYSTIKKSGKTLIEALFLLWWALSHDYDEIILAANDFDQSQGRVFKVMCGLIRHNPALKREAKIFADKIVFNNGTVVNVISNDAAGEAGANQGAVGYDELWGYVAERSTRLWEELTPLANKPSVRFISTYAGWENESKLLWDLYLQAVDSTEHRDGQAERIHDEYPIYVNRDAGIFAYWDHEPRLPWQTPAYYANQKKNLRAGTYLRLHENRWATAQERFITADLWDPCIDREHSAILSGGAIFGGIDGAIKRDTASCQWVKWGVDGKSLILVHHQIWRPTPTEPLDLENTIEKHVLEMRERFSVQKILADPWQMARSIKTLQDKAVPIEEFPQTTGNCSFMGQTLFNLLQEKNIKLYASAEMREQALNTVAIENVRGWRIAKEKASKKIDSIVALAIACVAAIQAGPQPDYGDDLGISLGGGSRVDFSELL